MPDSRAPTTSAPPVPPALRPALQARVAAIARAAAAHAIDEMRGREFSSFRCGTELPADLVPARPREQQDFRLAVRAAMRPILEAAWPGRTCEGNDSDVVVDARPDTQDALVTISPVFVAGRYLKLARGLSQTIFFCRRCKGRGWGCDDCGTTGRSVAESVEDFVSWPILRALGGDLALFHGAGREDVDVRMLGPGRPFVVSLERPVRRTLDAAAVAALTADVHASSGGRIAVREVETTDRDAVRRVTTSHGSKCYRAVAEIRGDGEFPADTAERLRSLVGVELAQRTPHRVDARRADLVRSRRVLEIAVVSFAPRRIEIDVATDPGTYVKELVSGDEGRTTPSVAGVLGVCCACTELDVTAVATS